MFRVTLVVCVFSFLSGVVGTPVDNSNDGEKLAKLLEKLVEAPRARNNLDSKILRKLEIDALTEKVLTNLNHVTELEDDLESRAIAQELQIDTDLENLRSLLEQDVIARSRALDDENDDLEDDGKYMNRRWWGWPICTTCGDETKAIGTSPSGNDTLKTSKTGKNRNT
ncbi:hypothetical protein ACF0H5_024498 [Mactra antiquata]